MSTDTWMSLFAWKNSLKELQQAREKDPEAADWYRRLENYAQKQIDKLEKNVDN